MELEQRIETLFDDMKIKRSSSKEHKDLGNFELKQIEYKLNKHLQDKQKISFKRVSVFNYNDDTAYNEGKFNLVLDKDVEQYAASKRWQSMPMCLKWKYVQEYLIENNITEINEYKEKLKKGLLQVNFDSKNRNILSLALI